MDKIAIISTRLGGIDGVSVEAGKWARAYARLGLEPIYIAGSIGKICYNSFKVEEMDYYHPAVEKIRFLAFSKNARSSDEIDKDDLKPGAGLLSFGLVDLRKSINNLKSIIKGRLLSIVKKNEIKYFSVENALSIPLNIPLGIALSEIILEQRIATITRHHDFYWEREEFLGCHVQDILEQYFPPKALNIKHIVINTLAQKSLFSKKGIEATYIPNVFDFDILSQKREDPKKLRNFLNVGEQDYLFLQPTRVIRRKKIERSIELVEKLSQIMNKNIFLFITGIPEKSEMDYFHNIIAMAREKKVNLILWQDYSGRNNLKKDMFERYNIFDIYNCCDLVTLPSDIEGFGNPVIEACAFRKPLFVNNYPVLRDMLSKGFDFVVINGVVDQNCIDRIKRILADDNYREKLVERNYKIAHKFYSMEFLVKKLEKVLCEKFFKTF